MLPISTILESYHLCKIFVFRWMQFKAEGNEETSGACRFWIPTKQFSYFFSLNFKLKKEKLFGSELSHCCLNYKLCYNIDNQVSLFSANTDWKKIAFQHWLTHMTLPHTQISYTNQNYYLCHHLRFTNQIRISI